MLERCKEVRHPIRKGETMTKTALLGICLVAFSGCGNDPPEASSGPDTPEATSGAESPDPGQAPSVSPPTPPKPMTEEVALEFDVDVVDGQATIRGRTNLPAGTILMTSVSTTQGPFLYFRGETAVADDGTFQDGPFNNEGKKLNGAYRASIHMPFPRVQPESVKAVIGPRGEHLRGPLLRSEDDGRGRTVTVNLSKTFVVGE